MPSVTSQKLCRQLVQTTLPHVACRSFQLFAYFHSAKNFKGASFLEDLLIDVCHGLATEPVSRKEMGRFRDQTSVLGASCQAGELGLL